MKEKMLPSEDFAYKGQEVTKQNVNFYISFFTEESLPLFSKHLLHFFNALLSQSRTEQ